MDFLDLVNNLTPEDLSQLADIIGATAMVTVEMIEDEDPQAPTIEMRKLSEECAQLGQMLSVKLRAFDKAFTAATKPKV